MQIEEPARTGVLLDARLTQKKRGFVFAFRASVKAYVFGL